MSEIVFNQEVAEKLGHYVYRLVDPRNGDVARASKAEVILATVRGLIVGAFIPTEWKKATPDNFPGVSVSDSDAKRYGFDGYEAPNEIANLYVGKRVPDRLRKRGAANPIRYTWLNEG